MLKPLTLSTLLVVTAFAIGCSSSAGPSECDTTQAAGAAPDLNSGAVPECEE